MVVENVYTLPGVGRLVVQGIEQRDYPLVQSIVFVVAALVIFVNLVVDLCYAWIDPSKSAIPDERDCRSAGPGWARSRGRRPLSVGRAAECAHAARRCPPSGVHSRRSQSVPSWRLTHRTLLYPLNMLQAWAALFPFGTDDLGRDLLSRILSGIRVSLAVGIGSITVSLLVGASLGLVGGYFGGWFDALVMRLMDVVVAFPAMLLAIAIMTMLGSSLQNVALAIAIIYVPIFARIMRASVISVRGEQYIEAAQSVGAG